MVVAAAAAERGVGIDGDWKEGGSVVAAAGHCA